jgi:prevent-host-death family protein
MAKATETPEDVLPFSALSEKTQRLVDQVQKTKRPLVITRSGQSAVVLVDAEEYGLQQRRLMLMERIARGKRDITEGRTHTQEEVEALLESLFGGDE